MSQVQGQGETQGHCGKWLKNHFALTLGIDKTLGMQVPIILQAYNLKQLDA
jgi:hypothetical protein